tara:strand:+ start:512 stop:949 length:438 start_codon:yes stop_codon:yes gene_type:complete
MSYLLVINGILFALTLLGAAAVAYLAWVNRQRFRTNQMIGQELQTIIEGAQKSLKSQRQLMESGKFDGPMDLNDPAILSTLVTVIIGKCGALRLKMEDFEEIPDGEFVTVYLDSATSELILSLNHDLASKDPILANFSSDDDVFH